MKTSTVNTKESNVNNTFALTKERYHQVVETFKAFVKDKDNHPKKDEKYGTKYSGKVKLVHFVLYAIIRNQDPSKTSHNPEDSEKYSSAISALKSVMTNYEECKTSFYYKAYFKDSFGITEKELNSLLKEFFEEIQEDK